MTIYHYTKRLWGRKALFSGFVSNNAFVVTLCGIAFRKMNIFVCNSHIAEVFTCILGQQLCEMDIVARKLSHGEAKQ